MVAQAPATGSVGKGYHSNNNIVTPPIKDTPKEYKPSNNGQTDRLVYTLYAK